MEIRHDTSTPRRSESNGVAEQAVKRVSEGSKASLVQSGLGHIWWRESAVCAADDMAITPADGQPSAYEQRRGEPFPGQILPFGCGIQYRVASKKHKNESDAFGGPTRHGLFMGYHFHNVRPNI